MDAVPLLSLAIFDEGRMEETTAVIIDDNTVITGILGPEDGSV